MFQLLTDPWAIFVTYRMQFSQTFNVLYSQHIVRFTKGKALNTAKA